jgi:hypothetical protein
MEDEVGGTCGTNGREEERDSKIREDELGMSYETNRIREISTKSGSDALEKKLTARHKHRQRLEGNIKMNLKVGADLLGFKTWANGRLLSAWQ